ncbi:MAG: TraX family protein [Miniphocaeibacter sp.]|uniref:TraX family protein n=1 Tax=Miniphocaeibacter sp. TaxID=3100973 RepID=UPI0017B49605|nr:conjugal transfer protein TraX [Gallicola sp.]
MITDNKKTKGIFSANVLKWIAIMSMLCDHIAVGLIDYIIENPTNFNSSLLVNLQYWSDLLHLIGKIAFPIFVFLIVESFFLTKNRKKMTIRLFIFAIISEIFFDLCFFNIPLEFTYQNIYFTLLLGFIAMWLSETINDKINLPTILTITVKIIIFIPFMILSLIIHSDYSFLGIFAILIFYLFRNQNRLNRVLATLIAFFADSGIGLNRPVYLAIIPIFLYNGKRGKQNKYFFYSFYPLHLFIIYLIRNIFIG